MNNPERQLLQQAIVDLYKSGNRDYGTLLNQVGRKFRVLKLNAAQKLFSAYRPHRKKFTLIWSRGVGKTHGSAEHMEAIAHTMPRSVNNFIVPSYRKFLKEMIPALKKGLESLGYFEGLHYWIGTKPNVKFGVPTPYMQPSDYTNIIYWYTGAIWQIISQDTEGGGRALSVDSEMLDEALLLDKKTYDETSTATMRGSDVEALGGKHLFGSSLIMSSMPTTRAGQWLLDMSKLAIEEPKKYYYSEFNVMVNLKNLRPGYVREAMKAALYKWVFECEFLNAHPQFTEGAYYPWFMELLHTYLPYHSNFQMISFDDCRDEYGDDNLHRGAPLFIGIDWGARINYMVVCQLREEKEGLVLRCINEFFALGEEREIQQDMVDKFLKYYLEFNTNEIILFYGKDGNNKTGITLETRAELFEQQVARNGWTVERMVNGGANPLHSFQRMIWENVLTERDKRMVKVRINKLGCPNLIRSIQNAQTKRIGEDGVTKDKANERPNSGVYPAHANDPSDALSSIVVNISEGDFRIGSNNLPLSSW